MRTRAFTAAVILASICAGCRSADQRVRHPESRADVTHLSRTAVQHVAASRVRLASYEHESIESNTAPNVAARSEVPLERLPAAQEAEPNEDALTLADVEGMALQNNPSLATAAARVEAAQGQWVQAGLYPNPVIGYHATEIGNLGTTGQQGAFIRQRLITAGKQRLDRQVADREIQEAELLVDVQQLRVLTDVRIRFYDALVAQRRLELTRELARIGADLAQASEKLYEHRQVSENDLLQAEIEAEQAHILLDNAHNQNIEAWRRLAAVIGVATMQMTPLDGELEGNPRADTWEQLCATVREQSPELAAAQARIQRARFVLERARREKLPDLDVLVSVRHHNVTMDDVTNVQIGIPIPVFDANQGNISQAQAEWNAARSDARRIELDLFDRLAVAYRRYENARQQATRYRDRILNRARKSLDLVTVAYEKAQVDYLTLITAQQTFIRVNLAYLEAMKELRESVTLIEGQLLSGSLSRS